MNIEPGWRNRFGLGSRGDVGFEVRRVSEAARGAEKRHRSAASSHGVGRIRLGAGPRLHPSQWS